MTSTKARASGSPALRYSVTVVVDGAETQIAVEDQAEADTLAEQILSAAEHRTTLRLPLTEHDNGTVRHVATMVIDFACVTRTVVVIDSESMKGGSMGLKR